MTAWIANIGMVAAAFVLTARRYARLADPMPIHWNFAGEADRWARQSCGAWVMPVVMLLLQPFFGLCRHALSGNDSAMALFGWYQLLTTAFMLGTTVLVLIAATKRNGRMSPLIWLNLAGLLAAMLAVPFLLRA